MKKIIISILVLFAFAWTPVVSAEQSPESMMTCGGGGGQSISLLTVPNTINTVECPMWEDGICASCIISLEKQGCQLVDVVVSHVPLPDCIVGTGTTYLLSCMKP